MSRFFLAVAVEIRPTIKVLFIFDFVSDPESESEPESESVKSPESESESESERPHHDSAPLLVTMAIAMSTHVVRLQNTALGCSDFDI